MPSVNQEISPRLKIQAFQLSHTVRNKILSFVSVPVNGNAVIASQMSDDSLFGEKPVTSKPERPLFSQAERSNGIVRILSSTTFMYPNMDGGLL